MLMRPKAEMLHGLPRILRPPQQHAIGSLGRPQRQLINRQTLASSLLDPRSRCAGEPQSGNGHLGDGQEAHVIGDGADDDEDLGVFGRVGGVAC